MAKTLPTQLIGKTFRLLPALQDGSGEPHPYAGQEITIIARSGKRSYQASTPDDSIIVVREEDWGPTEADMQKILAQPIPAGSIELTEQLQTINLYTDPTLNVAQLIDLDLIDDSPSQPRSHYPEDYIAGLADAMKAVGMISPMLIRPKADGRYENVFGHCRKRAARLAGMKQGPAFVRELTDAESAQLQAVENLQRKDLDAFDEAQSFAAYIKAHNCTKDEFCRRTGLSRTQVYNRLKLATLHDAGVKALRNGKIRQEVATALARVSGEKHQAHGLKLILDNTYGSGAPDELMTVRKALSILREKFTLGLKDALWALDDATLVESAGACTVCPKRSGVDPVVYVDLLGDKGTYGPPRGENVCTDPACFDTKKTAQLKANQVVLEAKGKTVIAGNKARQAISAHGQLKEDYIALKDVKAELKKVGAKGTTQIETMTIQNPRDGKTIEVVKRQDLQAAGVKVEEAQGRRNNRADEAHRLEEAQKLEIENAVYAETFRLVREKAAKAQRSTLDMQLIAAVTWAGVDWDDKEAVAALYGASEHDIEKRIGSMGPAELGLFMLDCALINNVKTTYIQYKPDNLLIAAKHYGVKVAEVRKALANAKEKPVKSAEGKTAPTEEEQDENEEVDA